MTREEFIQSDLNVFVVEAEYWINYPGIYGIVTGNHQFIAYKNPGVGEVNTAATTWAKSTNSIDSAYDSIANHIKKQHTKIKSLKK